MPLPEWLGSDSVVATMMRGVNFSKSLGEPLDMKRVSELSAAHAQGAGNFTAIVYSAFILDQWFTKWMRA